MSLFDDYPQTIRAAAESSAWLGVTDATAALNAALAALPREELIEKAAHATCDEVPACSFCTRDATLMLVAISLIPEHTTATEEPE